MNNEDFLKFILERLEQINDELVGISKIQTQQEVNLREHMYRTAQNELSIEKTNTILEPIRTHVNYIEGSLKFLGILSIIIGVVAGVKALF